MQNVVKLLRPKLDIIIPLVLLLPLYYLLYKIYIPRVNAFGCFDDCFNFMGGFFLLHGKRIYTDFFYNHQPLAAFISYFIQVLTHPQSIFELVLRHRQFVLLFGLLFNIFLVIRFRLPAFLFAVVFELSKFYLFGDRFLAEAIIVYPVVYMAGILYQKLTNRKLLSIDYFITAVSTWFVIFMREPYIPLALFLYVAILLQKKPTKTVIYSVLLFIILSGITLLSFNLKDYFFDVLIVNFKVVLPIEAKSQLYGGPLQIFFYPIFVFFAGPQNIFKMLLEAVDILFIIFFVKLLKDKKYVLAMTIFIMLGLANLKDNLPGKLFYEAFHMIIWYTLFVFSTLVLIFKNQKNRNLFLGSLSVLLIVFSIFVLSPSYFAREKIDEHSEFLTNYGQTLQEGSVIKALSKPGDSLFVDGSDDMVYWQADRFSSYKYSWFTGVMSYFPEYNQARIEMFRKNPPDFYREFGSCPTNSKAEFVLPKFVENKYVRLYENNKPGCIFVNRDKLKEITPQQFKEASIWLYSLPKNETN